MNHSFKNRIAITTGIIFFVSLTVITIVNITNSKKNLQKRLIEHEFPSLMENIISEVDEQLMKVASGLQVVAEDPPIQDWLLAGEPKEFVPSVVERLVLNTKRFKTMGSNLISWNSKNYYNYANNNFKLIKITEADTWFPAFKNSGHDVAINAYTNHAAMGEVAFMNVRIDNNGDFLGIISVAIDLSDFVNNVKNKKIGEQGLNMMISPNGIVVLHEDKSKIQEYNLNDDPGYKSHMESITSNNEYTFEYTNETGDIRYVNTVYIPELDWYLISEASRDELFANIDKSTIQIIVLSVVFLFIGIILLLLISNYLVKSLKTVTLAVDEISEGDGDLTRVVDVHSKDEAGILAKSINKFIHNLKEMIINIKTVSASSSHMSEVLAANSEEISSTVVEVTSTMQSINDKTENLSNEIHRSENSVAYIRKMILELNKNVEKENEFLSNSSAAIEEMVASIISVTKISQDKKEAIDDLNRIASVGEEDMDSTIKSIRDISNSVDAMTDMIDVITNVSEQINILSMNAAIEAAHAGDAGKGFAVVADEIRKLAETTSNNTTAMSKSLKDIIKGITDADKKSTNTGETIKTIMGEIKSVSTSLSEVIQSLSEISAGTNQITTTLSGLIETSGDVQQTSVKMDKESVIIEETFKHVTSLSLQNKNGIDEITTGLSGISEALTELSEESTKNYENTSLLNSVVHKFITEE